jgi:hypothetical protein
MFRRHSYRHVPAIFYVYIAALAGMTAIAASHIDTTPETTAPIKIVGH